jgi:hypothetical protein
MKKNIYFNYAFISLFLHRSTNLSTNNQTHWVQQNESHLKPLLPSAGGVGGRKEREGGCGSGENKLLQKTEDYPLNHFNMNVSSINVEGVESGEAVTVGM